MSIWLKTYQVGYQIKALGEVSSFLSLISTFGQLWSMIDQLRECCGHEPPDSLTSVNLQEVGNFASVVAMSHLTS